MPRNKYIDPLTRSQRETELWKWLATGAVALIPVGMWLTLRVMG